MIKIKGSLTNIARRTNKKTIMIIGACLLVVIAVILTIILFPKSYIRFTIAPDTINISVDGGGQQTVKNGQTITVMPGKHTINVSQTDFEPLTKDIETTDGETDSFAVVLVGITDAAKALVSTPEADFAGSLATSQEMFIDRAKSLAAYPILESLPIKNRLYTVGSCESLKYPGDYDKIALCVIYGKNDFDIQPYVLENIRSKGYVPDDYEIRWNQDMSATTGIINGEGETNE